MSIQGNKLVAPIGLAEVYSLLGVQKSGDYNDVGYICRSGRINGDSLYKPYEYDGPSVPGFADGGPDGCYGYDIPVVTSGSVLSMMRTLWAFRKVLTWGRLLDFEGYDHGVKYAQCQWGASLVGDPLNGDSIRVSFVNGDLEGLASPHNMKIFKDCYMAVQIFGGTSDSINSMSLRWSQCGTAKIGESAGDLITVQTSDFAIRDKVTMIVPFISQYSFAKGSGSTAAGSGKKWNLNYNRVQAIRVSNEALQLYLINRTSIAKNATNSVRLDLELYCNVESMGLYTLYVQVELWDAADCKGNKLYTEQGNTGSTVYRYPQDITLTSGVNTLPTAIVGWNTAYGNAKSVRLYLEDPYNHYTFTLGYINL